MLKLPLNNSRLLSYSIQPSIKQLHLLKLELQQAESPRYQDLEYRLDLKCPSLLLNLVCQEEEQLGLVLPIKPSHFNLLKAANQT